MVVTVDATTFKRRSFWVDSQGRLLVSGDDSVQPLPAGAYKTTELLVTPDGAVMLSPE